MTPADLYARVHAAVTARLELARTATPGPWELGHVWQWAGVTESLFGPSRCFCCKDSEPVAVIPDADINGKRMVGHVHRLASPWEPTRWISGADYTDVLIGTGDGGTHVSEADAAHMVANDPAATIRHCEADLATLEAHKPVWNEHYRFWHCKACDGDEAPCDELSRRARAYDVEVPDA